MGVMQPHAGDQSRRSEFVIATDAVKRPGHAAHEMSCDHAQRISKVKVKFQDLQGRAATMELDEFPARIFLHEYDHLQVGIALPELSSPIAQFDAALDLNFWV